MLNKIQIKNDQKQVKIPQGTKLLIRRCCNAVLKEEKFEKPCEVSVTFVDNNQIAVLNSQYRNKPSDTDVLSFPLGENGEYDTNLQTGALLLGDIVISLEKAMYQSELYGHTLQREIAFLTVHSMYHLLGYDHEGDKKQAMIMREKEEATLSKLGYQRTVSYGMDM